MDPISAIGLAGSVINLVDFTTRLISKGSQYYESPSGAVIENLELEIIAENFDRLSRRLADTSSPFHGLRSLSDDELTLQKVGREAQKVAESFVSVLDSLKIRGRNTKWKSFRQALKTLWSKEDIDEMQRKLSLFQGSVAVHLLVVVR